MQELITTVTSLLAEKDARMLRVNLCWNSVEVFRILAGDARLADEAVGY